MTLNPYLKGRNSKRHFTHQDWVRLKRLYKFRCVRCSKKEDKTKPETRLTRDHIVPLDNGGSKGIENIQPLCKSCNQWKGNKHIDFRRSFKN